MAKITNNIANTTVSVTQSATGKYTCVVTADTGYKITSARVMYYDDDEGYFSTISLTVSGDGKTAIGTTVNDGNTVYTFSGKTVTDGLAITNKAENTTVTATETDTDTYLLTLKCADGYIFTDTPNVQYWDNYGDLLDADFSLNATKDTATVTISDVDATQSATVTGTTAKGATGDVNVTNNIADTDATHVYNTETKNVALTVTGTLNKYRMFNPVATYVNGDGETVQTSLTVTVDTDGKSTATATLANVPDNGNITITGTYERVCFVTNNLTNVSGDIAEYYQQSDTVNVTITANENTEFDTDKTPLLAYYTPDGYLRTVDFVISEDKQTATVTLDLSDTVNVETGTTLTFSGGAYPVTVVGGNYGAINVYKVTFDNLDAFSKKRFFKETTTSEGETVVEQIDLGVWVNRIKRIFCNVPTSSTDVIRCGNYNTGIDCLQPKDETITIDYGTITIPSHNGDNTDYQGEICVFIPFNGFVTLPPDYFGKEIALTYVVNIITGGGVAKLAHNGNVFQVVKVTPSMDVLYRTSQNDLQTVGGDTWDDMQYYGLIPYVLIKWYESINPDGRNTTRIRAKLDDLTGFNAVDDTTTITANKMLCSEQNEIYTLLQNGVYF